MGSFSPGHIAPFKSEYYWNNSFMKSTQPNHRSYEIHAEKFQDCGYNLQPRVREQWKIGEIMLKVWCWKPLFLGMPWYRVVKLYNREQCQSRTIWKYIFHNNHEYTTLASTRWRKNNPTWHLNQQPIYTWKIRTTAIHWCKGHLKSNCPRKIRTVN